MNKLTTILSSLTCAAVAGFFFAGCSSTVTPPAGGPPSNVAVTSATTTSITVSWTRGSGDTSVDTILVTGGSQKDSAYAPSGSSSGTVNGLTTNVQYSIVIESSSGSTTAIYYTIGALPTGLMVHSNDKASIAAEWTRGAGDVGVDTIVAMSGGTVVSTKPSSSSMDVVSGLSEGESYDISIHTGTTGTDPTITWMTAERTMGLKIYESGDPNASDRSGLLLDENGSAQTESISGASSADFVLATVSAAAAGISFESGGVYRSGWDVTDIDPNPNYIVGGLDSAWRTADYSTELNIATTTTPLVNSYDIPATMLTGSRVLICQTASGNLALIEIVPDPLTGLLYSIDANSHKYVTVNVSYQSQADSPYAARGRPHNAGPVERISAH